MPFKKCQFVVDHDRQKSIIVVRMIIEALIVSSGYYSALFYNKKD